MKTLTIKIDGKTHKQFSRERSLDYSVNFQNHVQTVTLGEETILILSKKPRVCYDLLAGTSDGLIFIYSNPERGCPTT